jgi:signal transduction histidine kinase
MTMNRKFFISLMGMLLCCVVMMAQEIQKSELQQRAEEEESKGKVASARSLYLRAFDDYVAKGQTKESVTCGTKATSLYYKESLYKEAFEFLHHVECAISDNRELGAGEKAALRYYVVRERFQMYIRLKKSANAKEQLNAMESLANAAKDEGVTNDMLYSKTIYYYSFGQTAEGNAAFKVMAQKLTAQKEYDKVDDVYQTLIKNSRRMGNASMLAQTYSSYIAWKDSVNALAFADEIGALQQQIKTNEASIAEKDSLLKTRKAVIVALCILTAILAGALVLGAFVLLYFVSARRKQNNTIKMANESNAQKAKFICNIANYMEPTLNKLDSSKPEVKALMDFSKHMQTFAELESGSSEEAELEDTQMQAFSEELVEEIKGKVKSGVSLVVNVPRMTAPINKEYVTHILRHLLANAAFHTPENGKITLEFKKRSPHKYQYVLTDSGEGIPEEKRGSIFMPFVEVRDLTKGDGLGLPICRQMAVKMGGDLEVDPQFTKGARFVLELHA